MRSRGGGLECLVFFGRWVEVIEVGLGRVGAGMRCGVQGAGRSRDRPGFRAGGRGGRIVRSCGAGGRGPGRRMAGGAPRSRR